MPDFSIKSLNFQILYLYLQPDYIFNHKTNKIAFYIHLTLKQKQ